MAERHLTILQLNDLHGYLEPHPEVIRGRGRFDYRTCGGLARIASIFKRVRAERPGEVLAPSRLTTQRVRHLFGVCLGLMLGSNCQADGATIAMTGTEGVSACQTCHGPAGEGVAQSGFPRLAGLGAPYMQRQLAAFADGTRVSPVMAPIATALSVADRAAVSAYYAALPAPAAPADASPTASASTPDGAPASALVGATLATRGRWADKLPACEQCHGPGGRGVGPDFPALAGQSASYLHDQLLAWKSGARPPGPMGLMAVVARKLSDAEARAVADHYASVPARGAP